MKKSELKQLIKEEINKSIKNENDHFLKNPLIQQLNKILFDLYDSTKILDYDEFVKIQNILKQIDNNK
jgi:hypothetical protein